MTGETPRNWIKLFGCAAFGWAAMYMLDPDKGRRRRAIARDTLSRMVGDAGDLVSKSARDARFRTQGLRALARRLTHRGEPPDELKLIERVRAKLGRVCSHPHAIQVGANHGRVTLSGPILTSEVQRVLDAARLTAGVTAVEDFLVPHERPDSVPSLQGGILPPDMSSEWMQEHWTPALRMAAVAGGGVFVLMGARRGGLGGVVLAGLGLALTMRGATNSPLTRLGIAHGGRPHGAEPVVARQSTASTLQGSTTCGSDPTSATSTGTRQ